MQVPIRSKRNHLHSVIESLDVSRPRDKTDMYGIFRGVAESTPRRGMMILFSDLLADPQATIRGLRAAAAARPRRAGLPRDGRRRTGLSLLGPHAV